MELWCDYYQDEQQVVKTVSWHLDQCAEYGNPVETA